jgi:hypothetical protein
MNWRNFARSRYAGVLKGKDDVLLYKEEDHKIWYHIRERNGRVVEVAATADGTFITEISPPVPVVPVVAEVPVVEVSPMEQPVFVTPEAVVEEPLTVPAEDVLTNVVEVEEIKESLTSKKSKKNKKGGS